MKSSNFEPPQVTFQSPPPASASNMFTPPPPPSNMFTPPPSSMFTPSPSTMPPPSKRPASIIRPKKTKVSQSNKLEMIAEESDLGDLFIINPPSFEFDDEEYVFLGMELPQDVEKVKIQSKGRKADVQVYLPAAYFSPLNVTANYALKPANAVCQYIKSATKREGRLREDPYKYNISFDLPFEIEAGYEEKIHPLGYDNQLNHCQIEKSGTKLEQQWHRVFMMIFKKKKVTNLEKTVVGDLEYHLSDICSDSDGDY